MSGNHIAGGQCSVPDDGQDAQNPNHGGTLSNEEKCANFMRSLPVFCFKNFCIEIGLALTNYQ